MVEIRSTHGNKQQKKKRKRRRAETKGSYIWNKIKKEKQLREKKQASNKKKAVDEEGSDHIDGHIVWRLLPVKYVTSFFFFSNSHLEHKPHMQQQKKKNKGYNDTSLPRNTAWQFSVLQLSE